MFNPWLSLSMKAWQLGLEAQSVIALRMLRMAAGGARAQAEAGRMVLEKVLAAGEAQGAPAIGAKRTWVDVAENVLHDPKRTTWTARGLA